MSNLNSSTLAISSHQNPNVIPLSMKKYVLRESTRATATLHSNPSISGSTSTDEMNCQIQNLLGELKSREPRFIAMLLMTNFEDGMSNEAIEWVEQMCKKSESVVYIWLQHLFTNYQPNKQVIYRLLRIIAFIDMPSFGYMFVMNARAFLNDTDLDVQEAALLVLEEYRTQESVDAIENTQFTTHWIENYAKKIASEIKQELLKDVC